MPQATIPLEANASTAAGEFAYLPLDHVWADPDQPRRTFDEAFLGQLAESIKTQGVIQPIVVRPTPAAEATYTIISGESRWRASQMAGKETIPALIRRDLSDNDIAVMQVIENLQRRDLSLLDTCEGVWRLVEAMGLEKAAEQIGKSKSWTSRHSTLGKLPQPVIDLVSAGKIDSIEIAQEVAQLMQADTERGAHIVGRFNGQLNKWGDSIADEYPNAEERAAMPEQQRLELEEEIERESRPPTRAEIREELTEARKQQERQRAAEAAKLAEKSDPEKHKAKEQARKEADKAKADAQRRNELADQRATFEQQQTNQLCKALGIKPPQRMGYGWQHGDPVVVNCTEHFHYGSKLPSSFDVMGFELDFRSADAETMRKVKAAGFTVDIGVRLDHNLPVTLEQAVALEKLLGPDAVRFNADISCTAKEVPAFIARFEKPVKLKAEPVDGAMALNDFIASRVKNKPDARIKASDFHDAYAKHCKAVKTSPLPLNSNEYGAVIEARGIEKIRSNGIHYVGIEVKA